MRTLQHFAWLVVLVCFFALPAQAALPEAEVYIDPDLSAAAYHAKPGRKGELRKTFDKRIQKNPRDVIALSHRAYLFVRSGEFDLARRDFERALEVSKYGDPKYRQVLWAYGWALYDMQDIEGALSRWQLNEKMHGGRPFWAPYTYALAYWTLRDRETALAWFSTAVRSEPTLATAEGLKERMRVWRPEQKKEMQDLFVAWSERGEHAR